MTKQLTGWALIGFAVLMWLDNMSDTIADLQTWHGAESVFTPAFVSVAIKQAMTVVLSVLGGGFLRQFGTPGEKGASDAKSAAGSP